LDFCFQGTEEEGKKFLTEIIKGAQLKISLCGYAEDGIPLIKLFLTNDIYQVKYQFDFFNIDFCQKLSINEPTIRLEREPELGASQLQLRLSHRPDDSNEHRDQPTYRTRTRATTTTTTPARVNCECYRSLEAGSD